MFVRYFTCAAAMAAMAAVPSSAALDQLKQPVFKKLVHPLPGAPAEPAPLRSTLDIPAEIDTLFESAAAFEKTELGSVASFTKLPVAENGLHISAGVVRNPSQVEHEIDTAISQMSLDPRANDFGQSRTAFLGLGYELGEIQNSGFSADFAAGARLVDTSYRGRLNYSGEAWRGAFDERYEVAPSVNVGLRYRF